MPSIYCSQPAVQLCVLVLGTVVQYCFEVVGCSRCRMIYATPIGSGLHTKPLNAVMHPRISVNPDTAKMPAQAHIYVRLCVCALSLWASVHPRCRLTRRCLLGVSVRSGRSSCDGLKAMPSSLSACQHEPSRLPSRQRTDGVLYSITPMHKGL